MYVVTNSYSCDMTNDVVHIWYPVVVSLSMSL